jgi:hypothetical protein
MRNLSRLTTLICLNWLPVGYGQRLTNLLRSLQAVRVDGPSTIPIPVHYSFGHKTSILIVS